MKANEARREVKRRIDAAGISYTKIQAKTVGFGDLARADVICVSVVNPSASIAPLFADIPKPSMGGYLVMAKGTIAGSPVF